MKTRVLLLALVAVLGLALSAPAQIAGFKISEPTFDNFTPTGADATFDVIAYGNTPSPGAVVAGYGLDRMSHTTYTVSMDHGFGSRPYQVVLGINSVWQVVTFNSDLFTDFAALDYGDGDKKQIIHLALDPMSEEMYRGMPPTNTFRGTFTHTYADGNFTIKAQLTPPLDRAHYGAMSAGVHVEPSLSTGTKLLGNMTLTFQYFLHIDPVSPLPPPYSGSYTAMVTNYASNTWSSTPIAVRNEKDIMVEAVVPEITATGSCPGMATITVGNLTPGERVSMWLSDAAGSFMIPGGRCAGTTIDLATTEPAWRRTANGDGEIIFMRNIAGQHCSLMLQALDHDSCVKTAVIDVATLVGGP